MKDLCSCQTVRPTRLRYTEPAYPFTLVEKVTVRRRPRTAAGSPHPNCRVNGATETSEQLTANVQKQLASAEQGLFQDRTPRDRVSLDKEEVL